LPSQRQPGINLWNGYEKANYRTTSDYYKALEQDSALRSLDTNDDGMYSMIKEAIGSSSGLESVPGIKSEYGILDQLRQFLVKQFPAGVGFAKIGDVKNPTAEQLLEILENSQSYAVNQSNKANVTVEIAEQSSAGKNGYKVPEAYKSSFGRPSLTESLDGVESAGRGAFGTSNHDYSVFHGLLRLEEMQKADWVSLTELTKAIHSGWKTSGISRKQTKKNLGSKLGIVDDLDVLDLQEHILAMHDIMLQPNGPLGYMLAAGFQNSKTHRQQFKKILQSFTKTSRFSPKVNVNGKTINIIDDLFKRDPAGGFARKYKANQPKGTPINEMKYDLVPEVGGPY
ncbi:MAG: hypothetical protein EBR72_10300, partial [Bacteroidetes bacterium]|nr:hypothetical protein [Bacteroidota bacterium]